MGFVAMQMLLTGAPAIMKIDVGPVSATACVGAICIAFAWCSTALAQLEAMIVTLSSSLAQYVEAKQSLFGVGYNEYVCVTMFKELTSIFTTPHCQKLLGYIILCIAFWLKG